MTFRKGFEADEPRTSEIFKLQKFRTGEKTSFAKNYKTRVMTSPRSGATASSPKLSLIF